MEPIGLAGVGVPQAIVRPVVDETIDLRFVSVKWNRNPFVINRFRRRTDLAVSDRHRHLQFLAG